MGLGSSDQVEKAVMNPVGSNGSSSSGGDGCAAGGWRSAVTRGRGVSCARRWKRWWF